MEHKVVDCYLSSVELIGDGLPSNFNFHRSEALEAFRLLGVPDAKNEEYHHTKMATILNRDFDFFLAHRNIKIAEELILPELD